MDRRANWPRAWPMPGRVPRYGADAMLRALNHVLRAGMGPDYRYSGILAPLYWLSTDAAAGPERER
eukprot:12891795-Prorocentrum_lima.AAC.1